MLLAKFVEKVTDSILLIEEMARHLLAGHVFSAPGAQREQLGNTEAATFEKPWD